MKLSFVAIFVYVSLIYPSYSIGNELYEMLVLPEGWGVADNEKMKKNGTVLNFTNMKEKKEGLEPDEIYLSGDWGRRLTKVVNINRLCSKERYYFSHEVRKGEVKLILCDDESRALYTIYSTVPKGEGSDLIMKWRLADEGVEAYKAFLLGYTLNVVAMYELCSDITECLKDKLSVHGEYKKLFRAATWNARVNKIQQDSDEWKLNFYSSLARILTHTPYKVSGGGKCIGFELQDNDALRYCSEEQFNSNTDGERLTLYFSEKPYHSISYIQSKYSQDNIVCEGSVQNTFEYDGLADMIENEKVVLCKLSKTGEKFYNYKADINLNNKGDISVLARWGQPKDKSKSQLYIDYMVDVMRSSLTDISICQMEIDVEACELNVNK